MIFLTIRRTSVIFRFSTSCFYQNLYFIRFSGRGNLLKLIPVVVRARLIMFGLNQINHHTLIWFYKSLALFRFWSKKKLKFCSFQAHFRWSVLQAGRVEASTFNKCSGLLKFWICLCVHNVFVWVCGCLDDTWLERESFRRECCSREAVDIPSSTLSLGCNTWTMFK